MYHAACSGHEGAGITMFLTDLRFHVALRRLQRERRDFARLDKEAKKSAGAEPSTSTEHYGYWYDEYRSYEHNVDETEERILLLTTNYFLENAERLLIPVPSHDETNWVESKYNKRRYLTTKGASELRAAIRKEKRERWEQLQVRASLLIGIMGTLIGIIALWKK
jgi:hypothetical protein